MRQSIYLIFILISLSGFSQDEVKKGSCSSGCHLFHESGDASIQDDHFMLDGFYLNNPIYYGDFYIDSAANSSDSTIYSITLPVGDSLVYSAYWISDGMCYYFGMTSADEVDSIFSILDGVQVTVIHEGAFDIPGYYNLSQRAVIYNSCLIQIKRKGWGSTPNLIRVNFQDPPQPEIPLEISTVTDDISLWLSNENTLTVKADQQAVWNLDLYSLAGQVIRKSTLEGSQDLDISNLSRGCYIARITNDTGIEKSLKFIK